jgi:hypothetical protein
MNATTTTKRPAGGPKARGPRDAQLAGALLRAMRGALKRSTVLLPLTEDDDRLQETLGSALLFDA